MLVSLMMVFRSYFDGALVSRLYDNGIQGRDGRCIKNNSCFQIFLFIPVCILLLKSPIGLIKYIDSHLYINYISLEL